jgi:predicted metal-binding protein
LLEFGEYYFSSETGDVPWKKFPQALQSEHVAKIPAAG